MSACASRASPGRSARRAATAPPITWAAPKRFCGRWRFVPWAATGSSGATTGSMGGSVLTARRTQQVQELTFRAAQHVDELADLAPLLGLVAARDRVLDAMGDVILQNFLLGPPQRRAHRRDLRDDVDAIAVLLHHAGEPAHLAFDPAQAAKT